MNFGDASAGFSKSNEAQLRSGYSSLLLQLIERNNLRETEDKDKLAVLDGENRRLKLLVDGISTLEFSFLETRSTVLQLYENEEKLLKELKKSQRETMEANSKYEALVKHTEHKLNEANLEVQRLNESYQNENSLLKAKIAKYESSTSALQQALVAKDKEVAQLRANCENLMSQLRESGV